MRGVRLELSNHILMANHHAISMPPSFKTGGTRLQKGYSSPAQSMLRPGNNYDAAPTATILPPGRKATAPPSRSSQGSLLKSEMTRLCAHVIART